VIKKKLNSGKIMPRKKIQPKPIEIIHCKDFDIEIMEDAWNISGHGSNHKKAFHKRVDEITLKLIDDFVNEHGNLKPLIKRTDDTNKRKARRWLLQYLFTNRNAVGA
jgi:hypothetical protein